MPGMDRYVVLIDGGFLVGLLQERFGLSLRSQFTLRGSEIRKHFGELIPNRELLRINWYDATPDGSTREESQWLRTLGEIPEITLRLGLLRWGKQKGVDALMQLDIADLVRTDRISDLFLLAGDGDFAPTVERAKSSGVKVHLIEFMNKRGARIRGYSRELVAEADQLEKMPLDVLDKLGTPRADAWKIGPLERIKWEPITDGMWREGIVCDLGGDSGTIRDPSGLEWTFPVGDLAVRRGTEVAFFTANTPTKANPDQGIATKIEIKGPAAFPD